MAFALQQASPGYSQWVYDVSKCVFASPLFIASGDLPGRGISPMVLPFSGGLKLFGSLNANCWHKLAHFILSPT